MAVGDTNLAKCTWTASIASTLNKEFDLNTPTDPISISFPITLTDGTGASKGDQQWHDTRTLATGASEDLDVYGTLTNTYGDTVNFAIIRLIYIQNTSTVNTLVVGGASANGWTTMFADSTDKLIIRPGGAVMLMTPDATGYAVTASTGDLLKMASGGEDSTDLSYKIVLVGESA